MAFHNVHSTNEIDHSDDISLLLNDICMSEKHADVTFIVENTKVPAHKTILSARSAYFQLLLFGDFAEAKKDEINLEVPLGAFRLILKYIYTGYLSLDALETDQKIEIYDLAEQYRFDSLTKTILENLTANLTLDNCSSILSAAHLYSLNDLQTACMSFMDCHASDLLGHETFKAFSINEMCALLNRDTFNAPEINIFKAVCDWKRNHPDTDVKEVLSVVRWSELSSDDLLDIVFPSKIMDPTEILQMISGSRETSNPRSSGNPSCSGNGFEENFATKDYGAIVIYGQEPQNLLNGDYRNHNCTYQFMDRAIVVDLGKVRFINNINLLLRNDSRLSYSYYVDVSVGKKECIRLFDRSNSYYRSWQNLYFKSRPVRYIKLVGTRATYERNFIRHHDHSKHVNRPADSFDVVVLQAIYRTVFPETVNGWLKPTMNVATIECGALVEVGGGEHMLNLNSDEFSCHEKGEFILLQFNQPYYVDSLRMLLGNNMNYSNKYSFYISTSMDKSTWKMAVDTRNKLLSGWQEFYFKPRPAIFVKIEGTQADINFICTYFECPRNPRRPKLKRLQ